MNALIKTILSDSVLKICTFVSLGCILFITLYVILIYKNLPPFLPIYNQLPWGDDRIGHTIEISLPIFLSLIIFLGNLLIYRFLYASMPLIARMIAITTLFSSIVTVIFIIRITLLVL
jgi:hypothetical protein